MLTSAHRTKKESLSRRMIACEEILRAASQPIEQRMNRNESQMSMQFFFLPLPFVPIGLEEW